jgi:hypothetical protein
VQQPAFGRGLEREAVVGALVENGEADVLQRDFRRIVAPVAPAQRAAAQHDGLLAQKPGAERVVAGMGRGNRHAGHRERAALRAGNQHVRPVHDQARQARRERNQREPRDRCRGMRHVQCDLAVAVANGEVGDVDAGLEAEPVRRKLADTQFGVNFVGDERFDARTERIDARQHHVAQTENERRGDEVEHHRNGEHDTQRVPQRDMVVLDGDASVRPAGLSGFVRTGGFVSLGHAARGAVW